ncbi:type II secretion system protein [bacterium]|nr:type II secretion system protein [bacterium]
MNRKTGFTLAEVLITIGIIGVVAALTIPTLMANIQGAKFRSQFKKTVSTLHQAVRMSQAQYDFNFADLDDPFKEGMVECAKQNPEQVKTICSLFNGTLTGATYLGKTSENEMLKNIYDFDEIYDYESLVWSLADGSLVFIGGNNVSAGKFIPSDLDLNHIPNTTDGFMAFIDVNGISKPNKRVSCSVGDETGLDETGRQPLQACLVKNNPNNLTDIYPVVLFGNTVLPYTNAAKYVLDTTK